LKLLQPISYPKAAAKVSAADRLFPAAEAATTPFRKISTFWIGFIWACRGYRATMPVEIDLFITVTGGVVSRVRERMEQIHASARTLQR
jgi:hypothetical protein